MKWNVVFHQFFISMSWKVGFPSTVIIQFHKRLDFFFIGFHKKIPKNFAKGYRITKITIFAEFGCNYSKIIF